MLIRKAEPQDIGQLVELCRLHAEFEESSFRIEGKQERLSAYLFDKSANIQCLVVEHGKDLKGYVTFMKQFSTWDSEYYIYLDCLYLKEEVRGEGIGKKLMKLIKEYANQEGCNHIQWQTPDFNKGAIAFYNKLGAISKKKERFFWY